MYCESLCNDKPAYTPGLDRWNMYRSVWTRHWAEFKIIYPQRFEAMYGPLDDEKCDEVKKLIACGTFSNGFQRHTCPECGTVLIVPFTCKSRLCLSCARKRLFGWTLNLSLIMNTSLKHSHVTFTIPGTVSKMLFERKYKPEQMINLAANLFRSMLLSSAKLKGKEFQPGILATLHKSGNGLNYNPHVHLIGTMEVVDIKTGEVFENIYIPYKTIRYVWQKAFLNHLIKKKIISEVESNSFTQKYANGFHVYFQPIIGNENDILFRTAEYIATGYFHNSQITAVDHWKKTITFRYKKWFDRNTREKQYATKKMDIYEFMAKMLYFLPEKHRKMIRYYGIYTNGIKDKLAEIDRKTWAKAIEHSFQKNPEICPDCLALMIKDTVYSFMADAEIKKLVKTHGIRDGYFKPYRRQGRPP